jgi:hypothetical protein
MMLAMAMAATMHRAVAMGGGDESSPRLAELFLGHRGKLRRRTFPEPSRSST